MSAKQIRNKIKKIPEPEIFFKYSRIVPKKNFKKILEKLLKQKKKMGEIPGKFVSLKENI